MCACDVLHAVLKTVQFRRTEDARSCGWQNMQLRGYVPMPELKQRWRCSCEFLAVTNLGTREYIVCWVAGRWLLVVERKQHRHCASGVLA